MFAELSTLSTEQGEEADEGVSDGNAATFKWMRHLVDASVTPMSWHCVLPWVYILGVDHNAIGFGGSHGVGTSHSCLQHSPTVMALV